jgi:hypothetical protein
MLSGTVLSILLIAMTPLLGGIFALLLLLFRRCAVGWKGDPTGHIVRAGEGRWSP